MSTGAQEERTAGALSFGPFTLDPADERLRGPAGPVKLGNKAFRLLLQLVRQHGRLVTKEELFSSVWDGTIVSESALTSAVKELRRALGDESRTPRYIESVYGRGYRFIAEVRSAGTAAPAPAPAPPAPPPAPAAEPLRPPPDLGELALLYIPAIDDEAVRQSHPHLALVLREEILFALSRFRDIRLVSDAERSAAPAGGGYGDRDYELQVKLLQMGGSVRAFARISRLPSQSLVWAETMNLPPEMVGQCVEQLVRRIAAAALPRLHDDVLRNLPEEPGDIHDLYFRNKLRMRSLGSLDEAREVAESWESLIERHPPFVQAYPPLIRLYNTDFGYTGLGASGPAERARAYELARRALALDPGESHLHTVKGWCHLWAGEAPRARMHFEQALELNPYNNARLLEVATAQMFLGELDSAAELLERCRTLAPFATESPYEEEGLLHLLRGDYQAAADRLILATRGHPDDGATGGSVMSELYAVLAAAGLESADLGERAARWR
ncbi:MAG: winged helix-turn-helix domain-containing protein, partial [Pseudomonadota bacterium]|nr:winged helix-turn-helix domain-containing protein [Pseudomonadota bacterium]